LPELVDHIVEHEGGWACKVGDVFSETFATHAEAAAVARDAASRHEQAGGMEVIEHQDASGQWRTEKVGGDDRPETRVKDG
jgi:hypothetical protein